MRHLLRFLMLWVLVQPAVSASESSSGHERLERRKARLALGLMGSSPNGDYSFEVDDFAGGEDNLIVVRQRGVRTSIALIEMGRVHNLSVRFVGGDNLLASSSCGSPCELTTLFRPTGEKLASFGLHDVSPDGAFAVVYPLFDFPIGVDVAADAAVIDLRTGKVVSSAPRHDRSEACDDGPSSLPFAVRRWERQQVVLVSCARNTVTIDLRLPTRH